jgi:hypothetical protein
MGKGKRLREQRKAEGPKHRTPAIEVDRPTIAKEKRAKTRRAFGSARASSAWSRRWVRRSWQSPIPTTPPPSWPAVAC